MSLAIVSFILLAISVGTLSGLLGIGGNVIAIPILSIIFKHVLYFPEDIAMAIATASCMSIMIVTTISSASVHYKLNNINWDFYKKFVPFIIIGCILGVMLASFMNAIILEKLFGIFVLYISIHMLFSKNSPHAEHGEVRDLPLVKRITYGIFIGFKSGVLGIGGGAILIPLLFSLKYPARMVLGTTAAFSLTIAIISSTLFLTRTPELTIPIHYLLGFIYLPALIVMAPFTFIFARIGATLSAKIPHLLAKRIFTGILIIMGIHLLL